MRLGLHVNNRAPQTVEAFNSYVALVKPPFVKFLTDAMDDRMLHAAHAAGSQIIGRHVFGDGEQKLGSKGGENIGVVVRSAIEHPLVDAWEFHNEAWDSPGEMARYSDLSIEFMQRMEAIGKKAVIGCFSTGTPEDWEWDEYRPALEYAWKNGHYVGLHEYSAPLMTYMAGANQWNDGHPVTNDPALGPTVEGWHTLRYRKFLRKLEGWGIGARILITESGNDDIQQRPGGQGKGWRDWVGSPWASAMPYPKQLLWYGRHLTEDDPSRRGGSGIWGWVDFGFGSRRGGDPRWHGFDLEGTGELEEVKRVMLELPRAGVITPTPPPPTPEPPPSPKPPPTPPPAPEPLASPNIYAVVRSGEQLYALARRVYNLPIGVADNREVNQKVRGLLAANGWGRLPQLAPGQVVTIPGWATDIDRWEGAP